mmetsp:Transcript_18663/g.62548  ORF Transcript_18663/g.62548 Transcript_18663/m.62548 type:complete len:682 (-) Transcript_18663:56-2101(-)
MGWTCTWDVCVHMHRNTDKTWARRTDARWTTSALGSATERCPHEADGDQGPDGEADLLDGELVQHAGGLGELADLKPRKDLLRIVRVAHVLVRLSAVSADHAHDGVGPAWMLLHVRLGDMVHVPPDDEPGVLLCVVLGHLLEGDGPLRDGRLRRSVRLGDGHHGHLRLRRRQLGRRRRLARASARRGAAADLQLWGALKAHDAGEGGDALDAAHEGRLLCGLALHALPLHPPAGLLPRERGVLEGERGDHAALVVHAVHLDAEDGVVEHAHHVPGQVVGLGVHVRVPGAAADLLGAEEPRDGHVERPESVAPVAAVLGGRLRVRDHSALPRDAAVERDLRADHLLAAARVRVPADGVQLPLEARGGDRQLLVVGRGGHGGVDVELVDDVVGLVPPALGGRRLRGDAHGEHAVIHEVVEVVRLGLGHLDGSEPLDHAPADVARDDEAHREAVVRHERAAVLLPGEHDVVRRVHDAVQRHRGAVGAVGPLGQLLRGPVEAHVQAALRVVLYARGEEHVAEAHAAPHGRGPGRRAPAEADGLLDHVLLLAAVPGAHEQDRDLAKGQLLQVGHRDGRRLLNEAAEADPPVVPDLLLLPRVCELDGDGAVITHVVELGRTDEALLHDEGERRLAVEGVQAGEPDELGVPRDPAVWAVLVALVHFGDIEPGARGAVLDVLGRAHGGA